MIAYWPGKVAKGEWTSYMGHLIDFTPTLLDLAGSKIPEALPGHSLLPVLKGKATKRTQPIYWAYGGSALRDGEWKLVGRRKSWELYNMAKDPNELNNVAGKHPDRVEAMSKQWQAWREDKGTVK